MLEIRELQVCVANKTILNDFSLTIKSGEVHAIMGPNGTGKSTLSYVLAGHENYIVTKGVILFNGEDLLAMDIETRAQKGLFLGMQQPIEIPGLNNLYFLRAAYNAQRKSRGEKELDAFDFINIVRENMQIIGMDEAFLKRGVNEGFSGGEKKRNEILQMLLFKPCLAILDEMDSGLDIDALQVLAAGVNSLRAANRAFLLVTHYKRLLNYIKPDFVHVMKDGKIVKSGDHSLADELEISGYANVALEG
jgi:Fe-S cluster assembly ATP-binding protein